MNYGLNQAINPHVADQFALKQSRNDQLSGMMGQPAPISPMSGATAELLMSIETLAKVAEELRMRLCPVLRASGPDGRADGESMRGAGSPLRDQIGMSAARVRGIQEILNDILDRAEV